MGNIRFGLNQLQLFGLHVGSFTSIRGKEFSLYKYNGGLVAIDANNLDLLLVYCIDGESQPFLIREFFKYRFDCYATLHRCVKAEVVSKETGEKITDKKMILPVPVCVFAQDDENICGNLKKIVDEILLDIKEFPVSWLWNLLSLE